MSRLEKNYDLPDLSDFVHESVIDVDPSCYPIILGIQDRNLRLICRHFENCDISTDGYHRFTIWGTEQDIQQFKELLEAVTAYISRNQESELMESTLSSLLTDHTTKENIPKFETIVRRYGTKDPIKPKTKGQQGYVKAIQDHLITIVNGPAGTGKSMLAVAMACKALKHHDVEKIVLTRPVVEAGESLGFLPGDLQEKIDPYMRPLYDALYDILGKIEVDAFIAKGIIEIAPLAYMRGRTLHDAFVILDEAQNATRGQLKMFLTRFGENCKMVVDMDQSQIDLPKKEASCAYDIGRFSDIQDMALVFLTDRDISRHPVISQILKAYQD